MNALTKFQGAQTQLTEVEAMILAEMGEDAAAYDIKPTMVIIAPGGIGQFKMGDEMTKTFTAVVAISQKTRGYWPESGTGMAPVCSSPNGEFGIFDANISDERFKAASSMRNPHPAIIKLSHNEPLPESFDCSSCPMSQWGSEHKRANGKGKACKEMRRLLLLIDGWSLPAIFSLPPTSLKAWDSYCSSLQSKRGSYFAVKTKFTLDTAKATGGETYNIVQVTADSAIKDVESIKLISEIRRQYRELVVTMPVTADDYDTGSTTDAISPDQHEDDDRTDPPF